VKKQTIGSSEDADESSNFYKILEFSCYMNKCQFMKDVRSSVKLPTSLIQFHFQII
jgi:hypothetical protein